MIVGASRAGSNISETIQVLHNLYQVERLWDLGGDWRWSFWLP